MWKAECPDLTLTDTSIKFKIPVKAAHAIYRHRCATTWIPVSGNVPPGEGAVALGSTRVAPSLPAAGDCTTVRSSDGS